MVARVQTKLLHEEDFQDFINFKDHLEENVELNINTVIVEPIMPIQLGLKNNEMKSEFIIEVRLAL